LNNTFQRFLEKSRNPVGILLLGIPPQEVDVNIHPMKLEIKFEDSNSIYRFIKHAIESTFSVGNELAYGPGRSPETPSAGAVPGVGFGSPFPTGFESHRDHRGHRERGDTRNYDPRDRGSQGGFNAGSGAQMPPDPQMSPADVEQAQLFAGDFLKEEDFSLIGQYKNSYIIIERNQELLIIDQHNAQERVNFDKLKKQYQEGSVTSISPLFPVIIELTASEAARLNDEKKKLLEKIGFRMEPLSGNSFDVKSFPQVLGEKSIKDALLEIIHMQEDQVNFEDKVLADIACKSAIKVNHKLYPDQMIAIAKNLFKSTNPYFCPHKRPIIIEFTLEEIEKRLKRK
jgi:DNA mismatch repair protein MutL